MRNPSVGSLWRKWDPHIHSPASYHWQGERFTGDRQHDDGLLSTMVAALNAAEPAVFVLMDYWTLDGWFHLSDYCERHPGCLTKVVFPGVELRLEAPTDYRLNTHLILDDALSHQMLREFVSCLRLGIVDRAPSVDAFVDFGKRLDDGKLETHGFVATDRYDNAKMAVLGMKTGKVTRESWRAAVDRFRDHVLVYQPYDTSDGLANLDWKRHPYDDTELMQLSDIFETRNITQIRLFLGLGHPTKPELKATFLHAIGGRAKPVMCGSDAHAFSEYGRYPDGKVCWIKADPTFAGLRQCLVDPVGRIWIGDAPPKLKHQRANPTKYIQKLGLERVPGSTFPEKWFDGELEVNPGMVAIIGNKGGGKSALADVLALGGNSHCPSFEFLNDRRFRKPPERRADHFRATIEWENGEKVQVSLGATVDLQRPERVRYLPQQYLEQLCAEVGVEGRSGFEDELKKVIFSHVPKAKRLGTASLDELLGLRTGQIAQRADGLRSELQGLNREIADLERETSRDQLVALRSQIELKNSELAAHDAQAPGEPVAPGAADGGQTAELIAQLEDIRQQQSTLRERLDQLVVGEAATTVRDAACERLIQRLSNLSAMIARWRLDAESDTSSIGLSLDDIVAVTIDIRRVEERSLRLKGELVAIEEKVDAAREEQGRLEGAMSSLQERLSEPQREYEAHLEAKTRWVEQRTAILGSTDSPGTLAYLEGRLSYLETDAPLRLNHLRSDRTKLCEQLFSLVQDQLAVYRDLYAPVEAAVDEHRFVRDELRLGFNVVVDGMAFPERLLAFINQGRRGTFYGQREGEAAARRLVQGAVLDSWDGVATFLREAEQSLAYDTRDGQGKTIAVESQLREAFTRENLYDLVFGLSYLRPRFTLQMAGKEVGELSPGERGILLLVFYLMLDREEIPLIIDQPEHNLDNASVYRLLEPCIRRAKHSRQIFLVTHNPNVAIVCDAEQVICAEIDKTDGYRVTYRTGAIENPELNLEAVNVLEGTWPAFRAREESYQRPA